MFKWACLGVAALAIAGMGWMLNDLRSAMKQAVRTINEHLPAIMENARKSSETLAEVTEDIRLIRELAGLSAESRNRSLVAYADSVLDFVESSGGMIGTKKILFKALNDPIPASEWCIGARKKAVLLTVISNSRAEFLNRLCDKVLGTKWHIQLREKEPVSLREWILANHPESRN